MTLLLGLLQFLLGVPPYVSEYQERAKAGNKMMLEVMK